MAVIIQIENNIMPGTLKQIYLIFIFIFLSSTVYADLENEKTRIISVKLLSVNYQQATVEVEFFLNPDMHGGRTYAGLYAEKGGYVPNRIKPGLNTYVTHIPRPENSEEGFETESLNVQAYWAREGHFYRSRTPLKISWPGPEYADKLIGRKFVPINTDSLESIVVVFDEGVDKIYRKLLETGIPINKLFNRLADHHHDNASYEEFQIILGSSINPKLAKILILSMFDLGFEKALILPIEDSTQARLNNVVIKHNKESIMPFLHATLAGIDESKWVHNTPETQNALQNSEKVEDIRRLLKNDSSVSPKLETLEKMYANAYSLIDRNGYQRAEIILNKMLELDPTYHKTYIELARIHLASSNKGDSNADRYKRAEQSLLIAKKLNKEDPDVSILLGHVYRLMERYEEAENEFIFAEKHHPSNLWLYANWGDNYYYQNMYSKAADKYLALYQSDSVIPRNQRPKKYLIERFKNSLLFSDRSKEGIGIFEKLIRNYPQRRCYNFYKGQLELHSGLYEKAKNSFQNSKRLSCEKVETIHDGFIHFGLWYDYKMKGDVDNANNNLLIAKAKASSDWDLVVTFYPSSSLRKVLVELIKQKEINIDTSSKYNSTPLHYAVETNNYSFAKFLLENGANPDHVHEWRDVTPIFIAKAMENEKMVKLLLDHGAEYNPVRPDPITLPGIIKTLFWNDNMQPLPEL